mgnify:CR=1 FL=1
MKKFLACSLIAMLACGALLAGCGGDKKDEAAAGKTKAAFVYVSSAKDGGYSMAHELGRQYVAKNMPDVETSFMESVTRRRRLRACYQPACRTGQQNHLHHQLRLYGPHH